MTLSKPLRQFYCFLSLLLGSFAAYSQPADTSDDRKWYQIEVFIYANNNPAAAREEVWPKESGLKYLEPLVVLTEFDEQQSSLEQQADPAAINSGPDLLNFEQQDLVAATAAPAPTPFVSLAARELQLQAVSRNILRQADFRPLFHKAWRQQLTDRKNSEQIIILGGERFDQHYELEGTISISVERYLHINTNLWFSTFTGNVGGDETPWPVLPTIPVSLAETQTPDLFAAPSFNYNFSLGREFQALTGNQYLVERTVTLRQHRRMRSNELHYVDHPLLGLLIKISPYEPESAKVDKPAEPL